MHIKSLAIAAALVTTAGAAQAADLGKPVKAAVDYVKVCDTYGAGFFYIPGSDTCLLIGGYVRTTWYTGNANNYAGTAAGSYIGPFSPARSGNKFLTATEAEIDIDARTNTEFGLLRARIEVDIDANSNGTGNGASLGKGYIQWGGLTAGRAQSMYDFYFGTTDQIVWSEVFPDQTVNLLAYTFAFGNGVSATLSLEDSTTSTRQATVPTVGTPAAYLPTNFVYGGNRTPDVVANLNVTQAWGSAQISGALHENYGQNTNGGGINATKWGYGILAGVKFNVPSLGAGDTFGIQATYTNGAMKLASSEYFSGTIAGLTNVGQDAVVDTATNTIKQTKAWAIGAGFLHNFSSTVSLGINGGVLNVDGFGANDYTQYSVGSTLTWAPVKGLTIAGELEYTSVNFTSATKTAYNGATGLNLANANSLVAGVRVKRAF